MWRKKKIAIQLPIFHSSIDIQNNFSNLCITVGGPNLQNPVTILCILKNCDGNLTFAVAMVNGGTCFRVKCLRLYLTAICCLIPMKNYTHRELHTMTNYGKFHANWLTHTRIITSRHVRHIQPCSFKNAPWRPIWIGLHPKTNQ